MLKAEQIPRRQDILTEIANGSTDAKLFKELQDLHTKEAKMKEERAGEIAGLKKSIEDLNIQFSEIHSLFPIEQIKTVATALGLISEPTAKGKGKGKAKGQGVSKKTGDILIQIASPSGRGQPAKYNKGQDLPQYVSASFKTLFEAHKQNFEAELAKHFTDEGKAYFATEEGKAELAKLVDYVKTKPVMPKKEKAPAPAAPKA